MGGSCGRAVWAGPEVPDEGWGGGVFALAQEVGVSRLWGAITENAHRIHQRLEPA